MESELFGHVKGAFTGATSDRDGAASIADGGTLFLDEICEMDMELQKKLLRFLQTGTYQKVGSNKLETVDIRFVCATNKDPLQEVREGRFREDLYYRLHVVPLHLPPLRQRENDVELLANAFLANFAERDGKGFKSFSSQAMRKMKSHAWPGNVRELQNAVQNIVVLNDGMVVEEDMIPPFMQSAFAEMTQQQNPLAASTPASETLGVTSNPSAGGHEHFEPASHQPITNNEILPLWLAEKQIIEQAINLCGGSINKAAGKLEVAPSTLYRKIQSWNANS